MEGQVRFARLRAEDGLIRGIVGLALILAVIAVVVVDSISMFSASQKVDSDAHSAATAARFAYSQTTNLTNFGPAERAAKQLLRRGGDKIISVKHQATGGEPLFIVSASRTAHTYVLKYCTHLPWIGKQIGRWLHPHSTGTSK